jgi:hypothetical protein
MQHGRFCAISLDSVQFGKTVERQKGILAAKFFV